MDQVQPITYMSMVELKGELVSSKFRILSHLGNVYGLIPSKWITIEELRLFIAPRVSKYTVTVNLLEGSNLEFFFRCTIRAKEKEVSIVEKEEA